MMQSSTLFKHSQRYIPGGVNSPVRSFNGVGGTPIFFQSAKGAHLYDVDGNEYIDYVGSWGPMIAGHAHPHVITAVKKAIDRGLSFGTPTEIEYQLAKKICEIMPSIEQIRMVSSGTEATMTALRLARGYTKRDKILKFEGCYHGHNDALLVAAGSGLLTLGVPSSAGVPADFVKHTLIAEFNHLEQVKALFKSHGKDIAAIIVEPIAGNMNFILPKPDFLKGLRELCDQYGSLLIFDEVMTGFRVALGGAQSLYDITPDLTTLAKVIGGGMPVGALGGRRDIMAYLAPLGPVYQAGTLSGNPIAMTAGLATLELLSAPGFFETLTDHCLYLTEGLNYLGIKALGIGGMFGFFFTDNPLPTSLQEVKQTKVDFFKLFFHAMLAEGVYLAPSAFEAGFISSAHTRQDIDKTLAAVKKVLSALTSFEINEIR